MWGGEKRGITKNQLNETQRFSVLSVCLSTQPEHGEGGGEGEGGEGEGAQVIELWWLLHGLCELLAEDSDAITMRPVLWL